MKRHRTLKWLASSIATIIVAGGCSNKETSFVKLPSKETRQLAMMRQTDGNGSFISSLPEVNDTISSTEMTHSTRKMVHKDEEMTFLEDEAEIVFPKHLGDFEMFMLDIHSGYTSFFTDRSKWPQSICYVSEKLMSSACIVIETLPVDALGNPIGLEECMNKMRERIVEVSGGKTPTALYGKVPLKSWQPTIQELDIGEPSPEIKFDISGMAYRSISWSWRCPNERMKWFLLEDNGLHSAGMFWHVTV